MTSLLSSASRTIGCKGGHCPLVQATPCVASLCPVQIPPGITVSDSPIIFTFSSLFFYSSPLNHVATITYEYVDHVPYIMSPAIVFVEVF